MIKRNFGLDLCRAIAIIIVIISHIRGYFSKYIYVDFLGINVFFAVELFFVLSGLFDRKNNNKRFKKILFKKMV